jgi:protein-S-isoprenylcysteine O-methyltransferase Ste14
MNPNAINYPYAGVGIFLWIGLIVMIVAVAKSSRKWAAFGRIIGWTVVQVLVVFFLVYVVMFFLHNSAAPEIAAGFADVVLAFGLLGNSIRQLRANKRERLTHASQIGG